jgi:acyl-CoA synthetase (NDP forming)
MMAAVPSAFVDYFRILDGLISDPGIDVIFHIAWTGPRGSTIKYYLKAYESIMEKNTKPIGTWIYGPETSDKIEFTLQLEEMGFPVFKSPEMAVKALYFAWKFVENKRKLLARDPVDS